jgi:hypothetical protein
MRQIRNIQAAPVDPVKYEAPRNELPGEAGRDLHAAYVYIVTSARQTIGC